MSGIQVTKLHTFKGHKDAVYTLEPLNGHPVFFSGAGDGMVVRWDLTQPDQGHLVTQLPNSVYALQCNSSEEILVIGQNYSGIHVVDLKQNKEMGSLALTNAAIFDIKQVEKNLLVATGSGSVLIVDLARMKVVKELDFSEKSARCIAVNHNLQEFVVGYSDHVARVFSLTNFELKYELSGHTNSIFTVAYHPHLPWLLSAGRDAHIRVWSVENQYAAERAIAAHMYAINHIDFSPTGHHFVTCSMDKSIKVWDARDLKLLKVIDKVRYASHGTSVNKLYWSPFNQQLASCSDDRTITIWDLKT